MGVDLRQDEIMAKLRLYRQTEGATKEQVMASVLAMISPPKLSTDAPSDNTVAPKQESELWNSESIRHKLKELAEAESPWQTMLPLVRRFVEIDSTREARAYILQFGFLHAEFDALTWLFHALSDGQVDFYHQIHKRVRHRLAADSWDKRYRGPLTKILLRHRGSLTLLVEERVLVFFAYIGEENYRRAYRLWQDDKEALLEGWRSLRQNDDIGELYLAITKVLFGLGKTEPALGMVQQISPRSPYYNEALDLIVLQRKQLDVAVYSPLGKSLSRESDPHRRVDILMDAITGFGTEAHARFTPLVCNLVLAHLKQWFPYRASVLYELSEGLIRNRDSVDELPNLLRFFDDHRKCFLDPDLDNAIWRSWTRVQDGGEWAPIAYLHLFMASAGTDETSLWEARRLFAAQSRRLWHDFHSWALHEAQSSPHILDQRRGELALLLSLAAPPELVDFADIHRYRERVREPHPEQIDTWLELTEDRGSAGDELELRRLYGRVAHLRNGDLRRICKLAAESTKSDLAWRGATVLAARRALTSPQQKVWDVSGENSKISRLFSLRLSQLEVAYEGYSPEERKLLRSLLLLCPALPELFYSQLDLLGLKRLSKPATGDPSFRVVSFWDELDWAKTCFSPRVLVRENGQHAFGCELPAFARTLSPSDWGILLLKLAHWLSYPFWDLSVSRLRDLLNGASDKSQKNRLQRLEKWQARLSHDQGLALKQIRYTSTLVSESRASHLFVSYLLRLTTLLCPHHIKALHSCQMMRLAVSVIWDFESWLLSEAYTEFRLRHKLVSRLPVPVSLF